MHKYALIKMLFLVFLTPGQLLLYHLVESELERDERLGLHTLARLVHDADGNAAELILRTTWQRRSSARLQEMVPHLLKEKIKFETRFYVGVHILQIRVDQVTAGQIFGTATKLLPPRKKTTVEAHTTI